MARRARATSAASGCNPLRSLRSCCCAHSMDVGGRVVRGYRGSMGVLLSSRAVAALASFRPFVICCIVHGDQQRVEFVAVQASLHILWDRPCLATSSFRQRHRWHYQPYTGYRGLLHRTLTSSTDNDHKLCKLAFGCCLGLPLNSIYAMTC